MQRSDERTRGPGLPSWASKMGSALPESVWSHPGVWAGLDFNCELCFPQVIGFPASGHRWIY